MGWALGLPVLTSQHFTQPSLAYELGSWGSEQGPDLPKAVPLQCRDEEAAGLAQRRSIYPHSGQVGLCGGKCWGILGEGLPSGPRPGSPLKAGRPSSGTPSSVKALVLV